MSASPDHEVPAGGELRERRRRARRTALVIAVIAVLIYGGFIASGILSQ